MRQSNIELLRIASMIMIALFHFSVHGPWPEEGPLASQIAVDMLSFGGKLGVNCFVMITGYFMVRRPLKVTSLLRIVFETWFYSFIILGIFLLAQPELVTQAKLEKALLPVMSGEYWFITCYLALMAISPFLNLLYRHLSGTGKSRLMAVGFVVLSLIPTVCTFNPIGSDLVWFFYLYLLGGWLREQADGRAETGLCALDPTQFTKRMGGWAIAAGVGFVWASMAIIGWAQQTTGFNRILPDYFIWQYMVPTFVASVGTFRAFQKLDIGCVPWINTAAASALGVYLIHDNPIMRAWLWPHFAAVYAAGPLVILAAGIGIAVAAYIVGALIDTARRTWLETPLFAWMGRRFSPAFAKADAWLATIGK
ncbi:acyltransferase [Adlercreutzia sp. R21]|uniref:acyltransferase n=1 Tax=Adlercreutzia wanghongyangiae TaxID=3111451 RepID=UPI002DBFC65A|nr:acyltransferase [Adlercreutzia sp. R21]MEC4184997.1 acyltransferase [Adlercreutzia sp. R21]